MEIKCGQVFSGWHKCDEKRNSKCPKKCLASVYILLVLEKIYWTSRSNSKWKKIKILFHFFTFLDLFLKREKHFTYKSVTLELWVPLPPFEKINQKYEKNDLSTNKVILTLEVVWIVQKEVYCIVKWFYIKFSFYLLTYKISKNTSINVKLK